MKQGRLFTERIDVGGVLIGGGSPISVQTMCNTHTADVEETLKQCRRMAAEGADIIRITVPGPKEVEAIKTIHDKLREEGIPTPLVADIHFSAKTAIAVAPYVEKVRINPGNFHKDHTRAKALFGQFLDVCKENGTSVRIGLNHGSLGDYITNLYGNTPEAMAMAAMEWINMCKEKDFRNVVVSLKASNTIVMVEAYRILAEKMKASGTIFPMHLGVTEAGNGDAGRIKSCVGISALLSEGIGDTLRVSLTEDPVNEISVGRYLAERYSGHIISGLRNIQIIGKKAIAYYQCDDKARLLLDFSCDFGKRLLDRELDEVELHSGFGDEYDTYLTDELMQASRRRFYRPEYVACPGCGRTLYNLQDAFEQVKARTSHLKGMVIAVMGCIVNGPGELADADWGYIGEGNHLVTIYKKNEPVLRHIPDTEAVDKLLELIEAQQG